MEEPVTCALLIIRTWREDSEAFRAQIRLVEDIATGSSSTINVAAPEGVLEVVRAFLHQPSPARGVEIGDE